MNVSLSSLLLRGRILLHTTLSIERPFKSVSANSDRAIGDDGGGSRPEVFSILSATKSRAKDRIYVFGYSGTGALGNTNIHIFSCKKLS